jgi:glutaredoxin
MYYLYIILRENCPYSKNLIQLLQNKKIDYQSITVSIQDKEKYKTDLIKTFPQVYLKSLSNNQSLLLGGFDDIYNLINNMHNEKKFNELTKKYSNKIKLKIKLILGGHKIINIH